MSKKIGNLVAVTGTYMKDGVEKKQYTKCGIMFQNDEGQFSVKLETVPVGAEFSGWLNVYPDTPREGQQQAPQQQAPQQQQNQGFVDSDVPF